MNQQIRVLVTAVGGDLGQALVKALRLTIKSVVCHGCDMDGAGVGNAFVDNFYVVPIAGDATYVDVLDDLCRSLAVHAVVPASEPEIHRLCRLGSPPKLPCGTLVVCQEARWFDIYSDKLECMKALGGKIELAPFVDGNDGKAARELVDEVGFPVVVKSRRSSGSRNLRFANNYSELEAALSAIPLPFVQAFIDASGGEFSVATFVCDHFSSTLAFKRELGPLGCSWFAETSDDKSVLDYAQRITRLSGVRGSVNIQVRKATEGVRLLEVNPRFSSLVAARAACGFRDLEWSIKMVLGEEPERPNSHFKHLRFRRFIHELVDFGQGFKALSEWSPKEQPISSCSIVSPYK